MRAPIFVSIEGARELKELSARLKAAKRVDLQKKLRQKIKDAGDPVVEDLRRAVMRVKVTRAMDENSRRWDPNLRVFVLRDDLPVHPKRSTGLRARTANAIRISQTRRGIRIVVSAKKLGDYGVTLPRYLDADLPRWKRWRSPVFWPGPIGTAPPKRIKQLTGQPWFFVTIRKHRARFRRAVFDAIEETKKELVG